MGFDITFEDKTTKTMVHIMIDAVDQLLLSEGVCHQLGIMMMLRDVGKAKQGAPYQVKIVNTVHIFLTKVSWPEYKFLVIVHCWWKIILTCKKLQACC